MPVQQRGDTGIQPRLRLHGAALVAGQRQQTSGRGIAGGTPQAIIRARGGGRIHDLQARRKRRKLARRPPGERTALEIYASPQPSVLLIHHFLNAIVEGRDEPSSWVGNGPLPNQADGLKQVRVSMAIEDSADEARPVILD